MPFFPASLELSNKPPGEPSQTTGSPADRFFLQTGFTSANLHDHFKNTVIWLLTMLVRVLLPSRMYST